jgi:hypothetical protein
VRASKASKAKAKELLHLLLAALLAALLAEACSGSCQRPAADPLRFVARSAEGVVEVPDVGAFARRRAKLLALTEGLATQEQLKALEEEGKRVFGLDPSSKEGLAEAGLPAEGRAAIEIVDGGRGALWILPVADEGKFAEFVKRLADARQPLSKSETRTVKGRKLTVHLARFGGDEIPVAAWCKEQGLGLVGAGRRAIDLVSAALERNEATSVLANPEAKAIRGDLPSDATLRLWVPSATVAAARLGPLLSLVGLPDATPFARHITSTGWALSFADGVVVLDGRLRLEPKAVEGLAAVFRAQGKSGAGFLAALQPDAVLSAAAALDPSGIRRLVAPDQSPVAGELDRVFDKAKETTGVDYRPVLALFDGRSAVSLGLGDLSQVRDPVALLRNPADVVWAAGGLGLTDSDAFQKLEPLGPKLQPALSEAHLLRSERKAHDKAITVIGLEGNPTQAESFVSPGAFLFSNKPDRTDKLAAGGTPRADPLEAQPGLFFELRFAPLAAALSRADASTLAGGGATGMFVKAMVDKALLVMQRLDRADARLSAASDGVAVRARLLFASSPSSAAAPTP